MTRLNLNTLSDEDGVDFRSVSFDLSRPITVNDVKDLFMCSLSRKERLQTLYRIRSDLFTYDLLGWEGGYSPLIAEIDRALGLLEISPVGTADPEILQRIDPIKLSALG